MQAHDSEGMPDLTPASERPRAALRRDVAEAAEAQREAARAQQLYLKSQADERAREAEQAKQAIAVFLDTMRRAGNPGVERLSVGGEYVATRWQSSEPRLVGATEVAGWWLEKPWHDKDNGSAGRFLSTTGELYHCPEQRRPEPVSGSQLHVAWKSFAECTGSDWRLLVECMVSHGVQP